MLRRIRIYLLGLIILSITIVSAQDICPNLVSEAMAAVEEYCTDLGRNQACYGNVQLSAEAQPDVEDFSFENTGDIVDVADILTLELNAMDLDAGTWGVAVMSLQADIPNTLPGQNVTFILFGDVYLENAASEEQNPMQAFYLRTGIGDSACEEAPDSGLLIQTPEGVDEVAFNVNGVDVSVGSSVLFQTEPTDDEEIDMIISTVEGTANSQFNNESYPAIGGTQIRVPLNQELLPTGLPDSPQAYNDNRLKPLPIGVLPRAINIAPPLSQDGLNNLHGQLADGKPPCGLEGLPACEDLPPNLQNGKFSPVNDWGQQFVPGENCKLANDDSGADDLPICPPSERSSRPDHVDPLALFPDGDRDKDGIINQDDACPYLAGVAEFDGCPKQPNDKDNDGWPDTIDACPNTAGLDEYRGCPEAPKAPDQDGDGIPDPIDFCPNRTGIAEFRGCPQAPKEDKDSDGDGILDAFDQCPYLAGLVEYDGCPQDKDNRDTDGDGVPDAEDRCPNQRGKAEFAGCPDATRDKDADGIPDAEDLCPERPGIKELKGCPEEIVKKDSDGDGIPDLEDRCPNFVGVAEYQGCPKPPPDSKTDSDGDGIPDIDDLCPNQPGIEKLKGCPIPDTDGDGINDYNDACPKIAGKAEYNGCPPPVEKPVDSDGDGVNDPDDKCPNTVGLAIYNGCPPPDSDGDGYVDPKDACPNRGDAGYGLDGSGCPLPPPDSDGDGYVDPKDACPNRGDAGYGLDGSGCPYPPPDSDGDGYVDSKDACPNQGDAGYGLDGSGCPLPPPPPPDSDGDGINDANDKCPNKPGVPELNGCPVPDTDGDGINDLKDACPKQPGPESNNGCPIK